MSSVSTTSSPATTTTTLSAIESFPLLCLETIFQYVQAPSSGNSEDEFDDNVDKVKRAMKEFRSLRLVSKRFQFVCDGTNGITFWKSVRFFLNRAGSECWCLFVFFSHTVCLSTLAVHATETSKRLEEGRSRSSVAADESRYARNNN
jgi:hypothetical protein